VGEIADGNQGIEMVQFGRFICCLKLIEGERSESKKEFARFITNNLCFGPDKWGGAPGPAYAYTLCSLGCKYFLRLVY
jgi:hypothetical protein